ncbi:peptidoglycan-binding domain-containing protein [Streptomyces liangshanensis]|uniref:peptidoglycan-binding domain-containing protein n=1 Tax=Streptomyces liangshanensis TaxID=2717324 RepID=UPI001FBB654C|nr:peptidoglycan-binding domain-containing protein [Streptomyces liangshanensis]
MVTKLPLLSGAKIKAGQVLLEVSGRPVIALEGNLPVYRDLKPGAEGDDVAQLQRALEKLGHGSGADAKGHFGSGTKSALAMLYQSVGYDPMPADPDGDAAVESARDAVTAAQRAMEDSRDAVKGGGDKEADRRTERAEEDLRKAEEQLAGTLAKSGPMLPAAEVVFLKRFPARVDTVTTTVGATVSGPVLTVSSGALVVHGFLRQQQRGLVRVGQKVDIESELTGMSASGVVVSVGDTITSDQQPEGGGAVQPNSGPSGYRMAVKPEKDLDARLAGQDLRLTVQAASTGGKAIVVPVTAVFAAADGKTSVVVVDRTSHQRRVPVRAGASGDGYVEVRPAAGGRLAEGDRVITGVQAPPESR